MREREREICCLKEEDPANIQLSYHNKVTTTSFTSADSHTIYVGSGDKIYTFDLRMESLILNTTMSTKVYEGAEDEINQVSLHLLLDNDMHPVISGLLDKFLSANAIVRSKSTIGQRISLHATMLEMCASWISSLTSGCAHLSVSMKM